MPRVKICGITNERDALAAIDAGADALGFILYPKSPRYVDPSAAWDFISALPPFIQRVAVTVNLRLPELEAIEEVCDFDVWQFHGDETVDQVAAFSFRPIVKMIKAVRVDEAALAVDYSEYPVDAWLLDAPAAPQEFGGTGQTFDWNLAVRFKEKVSPDPIILSGGLNPENVAAAINWVHPYAIDVSSGVEAYPGQKDHAKLRDFIQICKSL